MVLERAASGPEEIAYSAVLYTPTVAHEGRAAVVAADGKVSFCTWTPPDPPPWLVAFAQAFLRGEWRARQGVADAPPWPARISRWRDDRKGSNVP